MSCVPIMTSKRPWLTSSSSSRSRSTDSTRSLESTRIRLPGKSSLASCSSRSTPGPTATSESLAPHCGHCGGTGMENPQWWHTSRRRNRCSTNQPSQIDRLDRGKMLAPEPLRQPQAPVAAAPCIDLRFHGGCRRDQHDRNVGLAATHYGHITRVITNSLLLLIGRVVLLIDDNQSEVAVRQKQRRARSDDHADLATGDRAPGARAPARRQRGGPFGRAHAKALREAIEELRGQCDFRHED